MFVFIYSTVAGRKCVIVIVKFVVSGFGIYEFFLTNKWMSEWVLCVFRITIICTLICYLFLARDYISAASRPSVW